MNYTYLLINAFLLLIPVVLFFLPKLQFTKNSKFIFLAVFITVFIFSVPTQFLEQLKVIQFNSLYLTGTTLWELPVEELLFSFIMPLTGLAIYIFLNVYYPYNKLEKYSLALSNILLGIFIAIIYFGYHNLYALFTFAILFVFLLYVEYVNKTRFMYRFYRAWLVSLVPFYIVSVIVNSLPVIVYNEKETLMFNLLKVPFESPFYYMGMLLLTVYFYEVFKNRVVK